MGVKFAREYDDILEELANAIINIEASYAFFGMSQEEWNGMEQDLQKDCMLTMADDIFFGLGVDGNLSVGRGKISYNKEQHIIKVDDGDKFVQIINLI